jgi:Ca2+-binding RTX toxin-like protein
VVGRRHVAWFGGLIAVLVVATLTGAPRSATGCTIVGTSGNDLLIGTRGGDVICAFGAKDVVYAGQGDDVVYAGAGNDVVYGGQGRDRIYGGPGSDRIYSAEGAPDIADGGPGADAALVDRLDAVRNTEKVIRRTPAGTSITVLAAGDIATCASAADEATAGLLDLYPHALVLALGDEAYESGTADEFARCYAPTWGRAKARTRPVPGNHEYFSPGARPYYAYFGAAAGPAGRGYYSFNQGGWHFIALNAECRFIGGCDRGSPEERWLREDLRQNKRLCTLAYWHEPRFSSGPHGDYLHSSTWWSDLYSAGADVVLNAHDHDYERFAPQTPSGGADPRRGIREFVVGTGGRSHYEFQKIRAHSVVRNDQSYGVLKLSLHARSYTWNFISLPSAPDFTDTGSGSCH